MARNGVELREHGGDGLPIPDGDPAIIRYLQMNKMTGGERHNKYYSGEWFPNSKGSNDGVSLFTWAAVGEPTAAYMTKQHTRHQFDAQMQSKIKKGYTEIPLAKKVIEVIADEADNSSITGGAIVPVVQTHERVRWITETLFQEARESTEGYLDDTPASRLIAPEQIAKGRQLLVEIENAWKAYREAEVARKLSVATERRTDYNRLLEDYMTAIPVRVQRTRGYNADLIQTTFAEKISDHYDHLLQLEAQLVDNKVTVKDKPSTPKQQMEARLTYIDKQDPLWKQIEAEVLKTAITKDTRVYNRTAPAFKIDYIFAVNIEAERQRYNDYLDTWGTREDKDRTIGRLYHATRSANGRHIVGKDGLIISPVAANGSRFGRGLYFADYSARSWQYTGTEWSSSCPRIMFVADVALGRMCDLDRDRGSLVCAPSGYDSVRGVKSHSNMDEFIVYKREQATLRLMLCLSPT